MTYATPADLEAQHLGELAQTGMREVAGSETMVKWALIAAVAMTFIVRLPDIITALALVLK